MSTYVVTGSESGIGKATAALLRERGHRVIGVDRADTADVVADLGAAPGRADAVAAITALSPEGIDGVVPAAGLGGFTGVDSALLVSVNYFGAVDLVNGLRPLLEKSGNAAVVVLASNSITCQPGWSGEVAGACLDGDESKARAIAAELEAVHCYPSTKAALAYWARREGIKSDWAGKGIRINAVAPGLIATAMTEQLRKDPNLGVFADSYPSALNRPGRPEEIANVIAFLLSEQSSLMVGSILFADGGTDAIMHPMKPEGMNVPKIVVSLTNKVSSVITRAKAMRGK